MFGRDPIEMTWEDVGFLHWPVDPATVADRLPDRLEVATVDGDAYLGVVPFVMRDIRIRGLPIGLSFVELNLRTYVDGPAGPGVYFHSLDADDPIGVAIARTLFALPYYRADTSVRHEIATGARSGARPNMGTEPAAETTPEAATPNENVSGVVEPSITAVHVRSRRTHGGADPADFDATVHPTSPETGGPTTPEPETRAAFLTENYRFYATAGDAALLPSGLYCGEIDHEPWPLREASAEIRANALFAANGYDRPDGDPLVHYCRSLSVTADRIRRV
ncbi:hypothetical protein SAMN05192561_1011006 [Halopenitus malekzadehii]|uniref:Acetoacetate decarboxylase (ADC) n=1 Tax=Halopenitus malekzadehii TaxID=1267564 RepID=A0A1H6I476_9EURY|nr:DUF2071 domain-containing protein [Halopenitus malekzadehii]SEH43256.1 hypothetical protein SAMN05192561_1011006 [Halopenitus malekzadehii]